jgi:uncharacterized coiled-coil protein SlyX
MQLTETQELEIKLAATEKTLAELKTVVAERIAAKLNNEWQRDAARLNWLEKTDGEVHSDAGAGDGPSTWFAYRRSGNRNDTQFKCFSAPTIRAAIDLAMENSISEPRGT